MGSEEGPNPDPDGSAKKPDQTGSEDGEDAFSNLEPAAARVTSGDSSESDESQSEKTESQSDKEESQNDEAESESDESESQSDETESQSDKEGSQNDESESQSDESESQSDETESQGIEIEAQSVETESQRDDAESQSYESESSKDAYTWEDFTEEFYYDAHGNPPTRRGEVVPFEPEKYLGFEPSKLPEKLQEARVNGEQIDGIVDDRTVDVPEDLDEDAFFSTVKGHQTVTNRYDMEKAIETEKKRHLREEERYWVNKPFAFVTIFHSEKENEKKYYLIEPHFTPIESDLREFLTRKLRTAIKYAEEGVEVDESDAERRRVIERETRRLLNRYNLYSGPARPQDGSNLKTKGTDDSGSGGLGGLIGKLLPGGSEGGATTAKTDVGLEGMSVRPEPAVIAEDQKDLNEYQVEKLLYTLQRDFIGYERIDGIKHDINVEDISCDGYNSPVFAYHTDYEQLITNIRHGREQLDDFVVKLAQRAGKGISKRQPQVDATLPDGSRAQLTLGKEVSDHGTNYTIRQFKDVPFTPVDLINWKTFSLDEMAFLWLCIENNKSLLFAGGTASGKTTSLNAVSLFIPSNAKIVSIEDTREVELPQRNWIASVTRPSFGEDETGDIDEFDLLEAALRQRPDYIIMGEVRGEEGRTLFQVMSTGHTTYTTFHADNVSEVIKRFTTDPINVSKTLFTALDLISIQAQTRIRGKKVRRSRNITEIRRYDAENDEINVNDVFQWRPETDTYRGTSESTTLDEIKFDRGWSDEELERELFERQIILAYLIENGLNTYTEVAATLQAYINDPDTILTLLANDNLESALADLREMESVLIAVDPEKEEMVPRPDPDRELLENTEEILERAEKELFPSYRGAEGTEIAAVLSDQGVAEDVVLRENVSANGKGSDGTDSGTQQSRETESASENGTIGSSDDEKTVGSDDSDRNDGLESTERSNDGDSKADSEQ